MKKLHLTLLLAIVAMLGGQAQLLWKISGNDLKQPSYLLGSHHLANPSMLDSLRGFKQALDSSQVVYGELLETDVKDVATQALQLIAAPKDSTLTDLLAPQAYATVEQVFNKYFGNAGITLKMFNGYKPAFISQQISLMQTAEAMPSYKPNEQIDMDVQHRAAKQGKEVRGLETAAFQLQLLFGEPLNEQAASLLEQCKNDSTFTQYARQLSKAYHDQDLDAIQRIVTDGEYGATPQELERLIYSRNQAWVQQLAPAMREHSVLVCVGAGHLPGEQGLIKLFSKLGYTLTPLSK